MPPRPVDVPPVRRFVVPIGALVAVTVLGTIGYLVLGFTMMEALYQTVTTVATVGFREVRPLNTAGELFTIVLVIVGVTVVLYNITIVMEALVEGHVRDYFERRRMDKRIAAMSGHVIVCGLGRVGRAARDYLVAAGAEVVAVDINPDRLEGVRLPHLLGDVTNDDVLLEAGIERARALIVALATDADTLYVVLSGAGAAPGPGHHRAGPHRRLTGEDRAGRGHPGGQPPAHRRSADRGVRPAGPRRRVPRRRHARRGAGLSDPAGADSRDRAGGGPDRG